MFGIRKPVGFPVKLAKGCLRWLGQGRYSKGSREHLTKQLTDLSSVPVDASPKLRPVLASLCEIQFQLQSPDMLSIEPDMIERIKSLLRSYIDLDPQEIPTEFVSTDCWHYKYFCFIRKLYGKKPPTTATSNCPYFWTCIVGSLVVLLFSPLLGPAWLLTRLISGFYRLFNKPLRWFNRFNWKVIDRVDAFFEPVAENNYKSNAITGLENNFVFNGLSLMFMYSIIAMAGTISVSVPFIGVAGIVLYFESICSGIWMGLLHVGNVIFLAYFGFFWLLVGAKDLGYAFADWFASTAWPWLGWFFTNSDVWLKILTWVGGVFAILTLCWLISVVFEELWTSRPSKAMRRLFWRIEKTTGGFLSSLREARKDAYRRSFYWTCPDCTTINEPLGNMYEHPVSKRTRKFCATCHALNPALSFYFRRVFRYMKSLLGFAVGGKVSSSYGRLASGTVRLTKGSIKVLGPLAILRDMFWTLKHRACRRMEFASADDIQRMVRESAEASNNDRLREVWESRLGNMALTPDEVDEIKRDVFLAATEKYEELETSINIGPNRGFISRWLRRGLFAGCCVMVLSACIFTVVSWVIPEAPGWNDVSVVVGKFTVIFIESILSKAGGMLQGLLTSLIAGDHE